MGVREKNEAIKRGSRVYSMWFGKKEYGTVIDDPRPSMLTPWHVLVRIRYDNPIYEPDIKGDAAHLATREINELYIGEADE